MAPLPIFDPQHIARGLAEVSHALAKREVDHRALETLAVTATIFISMGGLFYWGIKKEGSCSSGRKR